MIHNSQIKELLVQLAEEQCEKAYKSLFLLLHNRLIEFSAAIVKSQEDAEEIVSDFFIKVWQKRTVLVHFMLTLDISWRLPALDQWNDW